MDFVLREKAHNLIALDDKTTRLLADLKVAVGFITIVVLLRPKYEAKLYA